MSNYNLSNKKVLITGASGGIGKALCDRFSKEKTKIIFTSSDQNKINKMKDIYGGDHSYYLLNLLRASFLLLILLPGIM